MRRFGVVSVTVVVVVIAWLLIQDSALITADSLGDDASQNVRSAVNLVQHGIYSNHSISADVVPGFRREPFPNFLLAFYLRIADLFSPGLLDQVRQPFSDGFLVFVKRINLILAAGLFGGVWFTASLVFTPLLAAHWLAAVQVVFVNHFFVLKTIDGMNTELIAGTVLVWVGALLLLASRLGSWRWLLISGVTLGVMALTKATGAYVALVVLPLVALAMSGMRRRFWVSLLAMSLGFLLAVTPWLVRNQLHFSRPVIAQGGGYVLLIRAAFNQMNREQLSGAFYVYAPKAVRRDLLGPWMDFSDDDLSCNGRLEVFNRKLECDRLALKEKRYGDVRSFYQQGKRAIPRLLQLGRDQKKSYALSQFRERPLSALITTLPIGWRGFWGFGVRTWPSVVLNFAAFTALLLAPLLALIERRHSWLMVSVVPVSFFVFYSLFSHFLPRYSAPLIPASLICLAMLIVDLGARLHKRLVPDALPTIRLI